VADTDNAQRVTLVGNAASRPKEMGGPLPDRPFRDQDGLDQVMVLATLLITFETLVPTDVNAAIAATAIKEAISVYSMAVAPCSFFIRRRKMDSIGISKGKERSLTGTPVDRSSVLGTAEMIDTNAWGRYCPSLNHWMRYGN
jgi:hypothetical protein